MFMSWRQPGHSVGDTISGPTQPVTHWQSYRRRPRPRHEAAATPSQARQASFRKPGECRSWYVQRRRGHGTSRVHGGGATERNFATPIQSFILMQSIGLQHLRLCTMNLSGMDCQQDVSVLQYPKFVTLPNVFGSAHQARSRAPIVSGRAAATWSQPGRACVPWLRPYPCIALFRWQPRSWTRRTGRKGRWR
jgi:hypothetical protein